MTRRRLIIGAVALAAVAILAFVVWREIARSNQIAVLREEAKRFEQVAKSNQDALEQASAVVASAEMEAAQSAQKARASDERLKAKEEAYRRERSELEARTRRAEQEAKQIGQELERAKSEVSSLSQDQLAAEVERGLRGRDSLARFLNCGDGQYCANGQAATEIRILQLDFAAALRRQANLQELIAAAREEASASEGLQAALIRTLDDHRAALDYSMTRDDLQKAENKALKDLLSTREDQLGNSRKQLKAYRWYYFWKKPKRVAIEAVLIKLAYEAGQRSK